MERSEILEKLKEVMKPYISSEIDTNNIDESKDLINDLKVNSAHIVDIVLDIENEFDVMVDDDSIEKMTTVGASIDIIEKLLA